MLIGPHIQRSLSLAGTILSISCAMVYHNHKTNLKLIVWTTRSVLQHGNVLLYEQSIVQVLASIMAHKDSAVLKQYQNHTFALSKGKFPHKTAYVAES